MTKIKICGLLRNIDIDYANYLKPDFIGFVFAERSKRYVNFERAAELKSRLDSSIRAVGVFVDADIDYIVSLCKSRIIDVIQLHGHEDNCYISRLRAKTSLPIIQAFRVDCGEDIARANESNADIVLLDNGAGGTGTAFDWSLLDSVKREFILAGGLNPANVESALRLCHPYAVDTSSGVETDGFKDEQKMAEFISAVRKLKNI
ncbi:MAG: phosphoribosylanthranilate isomerase [Clostridiales bacterium]|nr:phosphoribosylanthranilate isomerase [Clostridiales bacterium]